MDFRCINCGLKTTRQRRYFLVNYEALQLVINQWIATRTVTRDEHLCQACWTLASESINLSTLSQPQVGHRQVCVNCGRSLLRIRFHQLRRDNDRESHIFNVIQQWNLLHHVTTSSLICHPCWCRADRAVLNIESMPATRNTLMDIHHVQSPEVSETTTLDTQIQPSPIRRIHCINCGRALQRSRYHYLSRRNVRETRILNVISKWTIPQQVTSSTTICHTCWVQADRVSTSTEVI